MKPDLQLISRAGNAVSLLVLLVIVVFYCWHRPMSGRHVAANQNTTAKLQATNSASNRAVSNRLNEVAMMAPFGDFARHPFAVARQSEHFGWTSEDGRDLANIRKLAHNEAEYQRMTNENNTIFRRQLVYQLQPVSLAAQRAVHFGEPISQITLPGSDGQELVVDVTKSEFESGGDKGVLTGKLAGQPDSMVVMAFAGGREAFTVVAPQEHLYLHAEPREPGELMVKLIDPNTYGGELKDCAITQPAASFK